jgi:hypothetical protein
MVPAKAQARRPTRLAHPPRGAACQRQTHARVSGYEQSGPGAQVGRDRPGETVAGFLAAAAIFAGSLAIVYKPVRLAPAALVVALIAAGIGGRHQRLAALAVGVVTVGWIVGMIICVITERPLF